MKLKNFLKENIKLNKIDKDVKTSGSNEWTILYKDQKYLFKTFYVDFIQKWIITWVFLHNKNELIKLPKQFRNFTKDERTELFNKLLTAIYQFIKKEKPDIFEFDAEKYLKKYYDDMINKLKINSKFLGDYFVYDKERKGKIFYSFSVKEMNFSESEWNAISGIYNHIYENIERTGKAFISEELIFRIYENIYENIEKTGKAFIGEELFT